jgi:rhodanese-related sulfurtransferase
VDTRKRKYFSSLVTGLLVLLLVALAVKIGLLWTNESSADHEVFISAPALKERLDRQERIVVLDIRPRADYASGHIPSAKNIPYDELEVRGPNELNPEDRIVTYCRCADDSRSDMARLALTSAGFKDVVYLQGGIQRWEDEQYTTVQSKQPFSQTKTQSLK